VSNPVQHRPDDARVRRPLDLIEAAIATVAAVVIATAAHFLPVGASEMTRNVARTVRHLPRVLVFACGVLAALATVVLLVAIVVRIFRYNRSDGLNALVGGVGAGLIALGLITAWHTFPGGTSFAMLHGTDGSAFVRDGAIIAAVVASDTIRYQRWTRYCVAVVTALVLTGIALGELTLLGAIVGTLGALGVAWFVRWLMHTTVRRPSVDALLAGLGQAGFVVDHLERPSPGSPELTGHLEDGTPVVVKAAGRDVHGAGVASRLWSILRLRSAATGRQPITVRAALETEALASLMASNAGVLAPRILMLVQFEPDTLVLARERLEGPGPDGETDDGEAVALFRAVRTLHDIGVAHRDLAVQNLICGDGQVGFRSLEEAVVGAGELVRRVDVAQLLTSLGGLLGAERSVAAMRAGYRPADERSIAAILQPIALSNWGWTEMRQARGAVDEVRTLLVGESETPLPEARIERFRWRTVTAVIALLAAAFILSDQLSKVDLFGALAGANWAWFSVAVGASALTYVGSSLNLVAFVPQRVSVMLGAIVEMSGAFFGLITPPTVGHVAINGRFLHKQGVDGATTASAVALSQVVNFLTTIVLLVVMALLTGTGVGHMNIVPGSKLLAVLGGLVALGVLIITVVPWTKRLFWKRVWPRFKAAWPQLLAVLSQPVRLAQGIGGNLLLSASYVTALIAALHAVGAHPAIIATAAVFMAGNTVGAAAPTPGGLGAVEAVLVAGLSGIGIAYHDAVPGVLLFRLATFWLPILPGWAAFAVLQHKGVL
jgi:uncharacterized membrane protein YbhN (UPF0104 family)/tRNA A-37 threonylcarbamoyl transferase component Bud32